MTNDDDESGIEIQLQLEDEYVVGLPMLAVVTARVTAPDTTISLLPEPDLLSLKNCIAVIVTPTGSTEPLVSHIPEPTLDLEHRPPKLALSDGERRRWLVDLSEVVRAAAMRAGDYDIFVGYVAPHVNTPMVTSRTRVRLPSDEEQAWIDLQKMDFTYIESWGEWVLEPPEETSQPNGSAGLESQVPPIPAAARLDVYLREIIHDEMPLEWITIPPLEMVPALALPEAKAIMMELHLAKGNITAARELGERLRDQVPDLAWLINDIEHGGGPVRGNRGS